MTAAPAAGPLPRDREVWPGVDVGGDLGRARTEWLHTNGAGAYASSTLAQLHTRRHHGLLVAALEPPRRRHVILSHMDPVVEIGADRFDLQTHQFPNVAPTAGYRYLARFDQDPLPRWTFRLDGSSLEQTLGLALGANVAVLRYTWRGDAPATLRLRPLLAMRPVHGLVREHGSMLQSVELRQGEVRVRPVPGLPRVIFRHAASFIGSPDWWRRFEYLAEQERGLDFQEDLWTPGEFSQVLEPGASTHFVVAAGELPRRSAEELLDEARELLLRADPGPVEPPVRRALSVARVAFVADRAGEPSIVAGYPFLATSTRDALIALPGLLLVPGEIATAREVLRSLLFRLRGGLAQGRSPGEETSREPGSADAALWLFEVARLFAEQAGLADPFVYGRLLPVLAGVFDDLHAGTGHGLHVTPEGLVAAKDTGLALTWMDAEVEGRAVTPRAGLPVELQALWARGCDALADLAASFGDDALARAAREAHARARFAFRRRFWCERTSYPYDVLPESPGQGEGDPSIRPNAVIALAVEPRLFDPEQARALLEVAERELVTPAGLRSLAPGGLGYVGRYGGGVAAREASRHQGSVWPYLLGFYVRAAVRARAGDPAARARLASLIESAASNGLALGQIPELADGDSPHRPGGRVAQAWSVAELLRALAWDLA